MWTTHHENPFLLHTHSTGSSIPCCQEAFPRPSSTDQSTSKGAPPQQTSGRNAAPPSPPERRGREPKRHQQHRRKQAARENRRAVESHVGDGKCHPPAPPPKKLSSIGTGPESPGCRSRSFPRRSSGNARQLRVLTLVVRARRTSLGMVTTVGRRTWRSGRRVEAVRPRARDTPHCRR